LLSGRMGAPPEKAKRSGEQGITGEGHKERAAVVFHRLARISHQQNPHISGCIKWARSLCMVGLGDEESANRWQGAPPKSPAIWFGQFNRDRMDTRLPLAFDTGVVWCDETAPGPKTTGETQPASKMGEHTGEQCGIRITAGQRHPNLAHCHPDLRANLEQFPPDGSALRFLQFGAH
jgi:hypothetical protein